MNRIKTYIKKTCLYRPLSIAKMSLRYIPFLMAASISRFLKLNRRKIVFSSFFGSKYSAQPKMISETLHRMSMHELRTIWFLDDVENIERHYKGVRPWSIRAAYELMTAAVWVDNCRKFPYIKKRKGQLYIQTWHGPVCIKAVERDAEDTLAPFYTYYAKGDSKNADYIVAEAKWREDNIRQAFWYDGKIIRGEFREIHADQLNDVKERVRDYFGIKSGERIVLYVPTFRALGNLDCYAMDHESVLKALEEKLGGVFRFVLRLHPNVSKEENRIHFSDVVLNGTQYESVNELIAAADVIISDYSGCIFDGYRAEKLVFLYATDLNAYLQDERRMYFDIKSLPSPLAQNSTELVEAIRNIDVDAYHEHRKKFVDDLGYYEDDAAALCTEIILKHMGLSERTEEVS